MKLKTFLAVCFSIMLAVSLIACEKDPQPSKSDPSISVEDITLQEEEIKDILVVFDPADAVEDYAYEIIDGEEFISIRNDKVTGLLAGTATVKVTTTPSSYTTTFKVTVTPDPTDPIEKFNTMGGFEGASNKELGWIESTSGQMAPDGENKRTGETALKVYGGWDESTETSLTFDYTISANLKRVPAGDYTLSYFRKGGVATEVKINDIVSEMTWTYNDTSGWEQYVCYFNLAQQADVSISFHFVADEESDNDTERWTVVDDISILKYKYVKMTIVDFELDLNAEENNTTKTIDNTVYTIVPALGEEEAISDYVLTKDEQSNAVTIEGNKITAVAAGTADITASFKVFGNTFTETFKVTVVDTSAEGVLGGIYKQTVDTINDVGDFETDDYAIATLGYDNFISDDSITEDWTVGDWMNSGAMGYKLGKDGLPAGKKIGIYLSELNFKAGYTYTVKYYVDLGSVTGSAKIFSTLAETNPYTDTALFSADAVAGSGFAEQTFTFNVTEDLNDVVLIFVFQNSTESAAWACLDDISISYVLTE